MIKHIVLFKMKPFANEAERAIKLGDIKQELEALINKVPSLLSIEVGININPDEECDLALTTTFNTMDDLHSYAVHPDHKAVGTKIREILEKRSCVDYQY